MATVCVVGLGYIGLPAALLVARAGHQVTGVDVDTDKVAKIGAGHCPVEEPGLPELLTEVLSSGRLTVTTTPVAAEVYVICVPTPHDASGAADLRALESAAAAVGPVLPDGALVILESTVPPGTTRGILSSTLERTSGKVKGKDFAVAHCPERVLPGQIIAEMVGTDRLVGGHDPETTRRAAEFYRSFVTGPIVQTDATTAEFAKLIENTYRDVNIALANQLSDVAESLGIDVWTAIDLANLHPRVDLHKPGPGVGGHCIAVDPLFLVHLAPDQTPLLALTRKVNDGRIAQVIDRCSLILGGTGMIAVLGAAYKGDIDDIRNSPAVEILLGLKAGGHSVRLHDPFVTEAGGVPCVTLADALLGADLALLVTDHSAFKGLTAEHLAGMATMRVFDTRNLLDAVALRAAGVEVIRLGDGRPV